MRQILARRFGGRPFGATGEGVGRLLVPDIVFKIIIDRLREVVSPAARQANSFRNPTVTKPGCAAPSWSEITVR
jgi:hypothetical protein